MINSKTILSRIVDSINKPIILDSIVRSSIVTTVSFMFNGVVPPVVGNFILREDGFYILREDGFKFLRENG